MRIRHAFLDIDGVLADLVSATMAAHGRVYDEATYPRMAWHIGAACGGVPYDDFWERIDGLGASLWADLAPYPWMHDLVELVEEGASVKLLSAPRMHPDCLAGKRLWVTRHLPRLELILCESKHLLAAPDRLLIDDGEHNVDGWAKAGGRAVLFPQPWNRNADRIVDRMRYVKDELCAATISRGTRELSGARRAPT